MVGSVKAMSYDPSFEPRQPICCRAPARRRRRLIVSPAREGSEAIEEVDGEEAEREREEMALMWEEHSIEDKEKSSKVRLCQLQKKFKWGLVD